MKRRLLFVLLAISFGLTAQEFRSTISGSVTDPQNTAIGSAKIEATELRTGVKSTTATDNLGQYTLPFLRPGEYAVTAEANGFKRAIRANLPVGPGDHPVVDFRLELGAVTQSVSVTSEVPLLETANASTGQTIATQQVEDFPLNGRTPMMLAQLALGVIQSGAPGAVHPFDNGGAAGFSMSGAATQNNELLLDGSANETWDKRLTYSPPQDAVEEVRVRAFDADASYGHTGGGMAEQITKSGTNSLHGSAYDFNQVTTLSANGFFNNRNGLKISPNIYNQYGMSAGGPLYVPKVYNGKNKIFWFFAYEGIRWDTPISPLTTVPTAAERTGDLSALLKAGSQYQIYDPYSGTPQGNLIQRTPIPNNIIPANELNPVALAVLKYFPMPNLPGRSDGLNNFGNSISNKEYFDNELSRADFNISDRNKLFWTFRHNYRHNDTNRNFGFDNPAVGNSLSRLNWGSTLDDVHSFSPATAANIRLNWTRFVERHWQSSIGFDPSILGLPSYIASNAQMLSMPAFVFSGNGGSSTFQNLSDNDATSMNPYDIFQVFGDVSTVKGNHTLKAGIDAREYRLSGINYGLNQAGSFTFSTAWNNGPYTTSAASPLGQELAAFLMGLPSSGSYSQNAYYTVNTKYFSGFVQDDWRVRNNLTLNLGLRFEHELPETERFNRMADGFNPTAANSASAAAAAAYAANPIPQIPPSAFQALGGLTFAGASNPAAYSSRSKIFSPRFGVSWTPSRLGHNTVLRAGFGVFTYPIVVPVPNQPGFSQTTQFVATNDNYQSPAATLSNPFPGGIFKPAGSSLGPSTFLGQSVAFLNPNMVNPYSIRWDFSIERQLLHDMVVEAAYIGNHSVHIGINQNLDYIPPQYLSTSPVRDNNVINLLGSSVPNPFYGLVPNSTTLNGKTVALSALLVPFPQFGTNGVTEQTNNEGSSYYESLNVRVEKRMSHGLSFIENFVWSKLMAETVQLNPFSPPQKQIASDNRGLHNVVAATYHLPIGHGQWLSPSSKLADMVVGGWVVNAIYSRQLGAPLNWSGDMLYYGGNLNLHSRQVDGAAFDTTRFNTVSSQQLANNVRTFPTMFANLLQDGNNNLDFSMLKEFFIKERMKLQVRFEAFNALNHPTFGAPNLSATSSSFGLITSQANTPRTIQLGARLAW
jgi:hypothetical protein